MHHWILVVFVQVASILHIYTHIYEPKVHDDQDNGVLVAINEELSEAYVLGDMKILDEDNLVMLTVSIS